MFKTIRRLRYRPTVGSVVSHAILGAAAGAAATWVMTQVTTYLYENESEAAREREQAVRGNRGATEIAAEKAAALVKLDLTDDERARYGEALHWGLGATMGAVYGGLYAAFPESTWKRGLLFGAGFFLLFDEGLNTALGLTPGPRAFPWQAHARGLAGHLAYGLTADAALRTLEGPVLTLAGLRRHVTP